MAMPAAIGAPTTRPRLERRGIRWTGPPPSRRRPTPASATVTNVDPTSIPAAIALSPPARGGGATEAISAGARPTVSTPRRNAIVETIRETAQDRAGRTRAAEARVATRRLA